MRVKVLWKKTEWTVVEYGDGIPNEMMIYGGTRIVMTIVQLFDLVVQQACCPKDWRRCYIVLLYKDGDPETASN